MAYDNQTESPRVLSIGQCGFDGGTIADFFSRHFGARVEAADDLEDARRLLASGPFQLVLVNRILDGNGSSGVDLIRAIKQDPNSAVSAPPVMLVSNLPGAQQEAREAGAVPGFGKADLSRSEIVQRIREAIRG